MAGADAMLELHAILPRSRANGPGTRLVVWFQGCHLGCPGCFNPETHRSPAPLKMSAERLLEIAIHEAPEIDGITISGGEPLEQPRGLFLLLEGIRGFTELSTILFSGHTIEESRELPRGPEILERLDVLIDGRYVEQLRLERGLRGSSNQRIHLLTGRHSREEIERTPPAEVVLDPSGDMSATGVRALDLGRLRSPP